MSETKERSHPAGQEAEDVPSEALLATVPVGVDKDLVVLDGHGTHRCPELKRALARSDEAETRIAACVLDRVKKRPN